MAFDITKYMASNKIQAKSDEQQRRELLEAAMHAMTREKSLDRLKEVKHNIAPYSKEAIKHIDMAIKLIEQFEAK
jgi:hypothetical protein